jgi:hypothetical protein
METPRDDEKTLHSGKSPSPDTATRTIGLIALGLGRFRVMSEHEHRLEWEREYRSHP